MAVTAARGGGGGAAGGAGGAPPSEKLGDGVYLITGGYVALAALSAA